MQRTSQILKNDTGELLTETCYTFCDRETSCENCISRKAYLQNRSVFKIADKDEPVNLALMELKEKPKVDRHRYLI